MTISLEMVHLAKCGLIKKTNQITWIYHRTVLPHNNMGYSFFIVGKIFTHYSDGMSYFLIQTWRKFPCYLTLIFLWNENTKVFIFNKKYMESLDHKTQIDI